MGAFAFVVAQMKRALEDSWRATGVPVCPNYVAARARSMGVDPVRAERLARIQLAREVQ